MNKKMGLELPRSMGEASVPGDELDDDDDVGETADHMVIVL
jgi:hypothetical protein